MNKAASLYKAVVLLSTRSTPPPYWRTPTISHILLQYLGYRIFLARSLNSFCCLRCTYDVDTVGSPLLFGRDESILLLFSLFLLRWMQVFRYSLDAMNRLIPLSLLSMDRSLCLCLMRLLFVCCLSSSLLLECNYSPIVLCCLLFCKLLFLFKQVFRYSLDAMNRAAKNGFLEVLIFLHKEGNDCTTVRLRG